MFQGVRPYLVLRFFKKTDSHIRFSQRIDSSIFSQGIIHDDTLGVRLRCSGDILMMPNDICDTRPILMQTRTGHRTDIKL